MAFSYIYIGICGYMTQLYDEAYYRFPSFNDIAQMSRNTTFMSIVIILIVVTLIIIATWLITVLIKGYAYYSLFAVIYLALGFLLVYGICLKYRIILVLGLEFPPDLVVIYSLMISSNIVALVTFVMKMVYMFIKPIPKIYVNSTKNIVVEDKKDK